MKTYSHQNKCFTCSEHHSEGQGRAGRTGGEIEGRTLAACGEVGGGHGGGVPVHGCDVQLLGSRDCLDRVMAAWTCDCLDV